MRVKHRFFFLLLASVTLPVFGATWVVPPDDVLIRRAEVIVTATVISSESRLDTLGRPETVVRLWVADGLKGRVAIGETLEIVEAGGRVGDDVLYVAGAPQYVPGSRVLSFLVRNRTGDLTTMDLALGQFSFRERNGVGLLVHAVALSGWQEDGSELVERDRLRDPFLGYIQGIVEGRQPDVDYFADGWIPAASARSEVQSEVTVSAFDLDIDEGSSIGTSAWSGAASIGYSVSGTAASGSTRGNDGEDRIIPDDPHNDIAGTFPGSTSVVATAFSGCSGCTFHTVNGEEYAAITYADVVINDGVSSSTMSQGNFNSTMVHEIGHTLGFRHSDRTKNNSGACASPLPCSGSAIMNSFIVGGLNGALQSWDQAGANEVYGNGSAGAFTGAQYVFDFDFGVSGLKPARRMNNSVAWRIFRPASACSPGKLCSLGGRFELSLGVRDHRTNRVGTGFPLQQNDLFGFFSLPSLTGDANNPEVFVKMLDGRGVNGNFWVFFGGLTDLEYTLSVFDKQLGTTKHYFKTGGTSNGGFDVGGGATSEACPGEVDGLPAGTESPTICGPASDRLCLNGNRFRVTVSARDHRSNKTAPGVSIPQGNLFGYFSLPGLTTDPNNPEVFVKVVDGRPVNGFYWVFYSGLTDFEYTITVVDTLTGNRKTYTKSPGSACGFFDTNAF